MATLAFILLCCTAQAFAQFEVSPDHFDATPARVQKKVQHAKTVRGTAAAKRPATGVGTAGKKQLAKGHTRATQPNVSARVRNPVQP